MSGLLVHFLLSMQEDISTTAVYMSRIYQGDLKQKKNLGYLSTRTLISLSNSPVAVALLNLFSNHPD